MNKTLYHVIHSYFSCIGRSLFYGRLQQTCFLKNKVMESWSGIDVQLKRRHDLIPNLVNTVKGYAAHESGTLEKVIQARNMAMTAGNTGNINQQVQAENALSGTLKSLFALSENYPDLKANTNFYRFRVHFQKLKKVLPTRGDITMHL